MKLVMGDSGGVGGGEFIVVMLDCRSEVGQGGVKCGSGRHSAEEERAFARHRLRSTVHAT